MAILLRRGGRTNDVFKFGICVMRELVGGARAGRATPISESRRLIAHAHSLRALARTRRAARLGASRRVDATAARAVDRKYSGKKGSMSRAGRKDRQRRGTSPEGSVAILL